MEFEPRTLFGALLKDDHKETLQLIQRTASYLGSAPKRAEIIPVLTSLYSDNCSYAQIQAILAFMDLHMSKVQTTKESLNLPRLD